MKSLINQKFGYVLLGMLLTLLAVGAYWQLYKETLVKKVLGSSVAGLDQCTDATIQNDKQPVEEIYFVGCGGFF